MLLHSQGQHPAPPLLMAVRYGCSREILCALQAHGADINAADDEGITPLAVAAGADIPVCCFTSSIEEMIPPPSTYPVHTQAMAEHSWPYLPLQFQRATVELGGSQASYAHVQSLLGLGANPSFKCKGGLTAADFARQRGMTQAAELICHWNGWIAAEVLNRLWSCGHREPTGETGMAPNSDSIGLASIPACAGATILAFVRTAGK